MLFNRKEFKLFLTFFLIYAYFAHWGGWNENSAFDLTRAIVDEHRFEIDTYYNDTSDRAFYNGHYYSAKAPGMSFLATPTYAFFKLAYYKLMPDDFIGRHKGTDESWVRLIGHESVPIQIRPKPGLFILTSMFLVTIMTSVLFSALTVVLIYKTSKLLTDNENHCLLVAVIYGASTLAFHYSLVFVTHATGTFFAFFAFYLVFKMRRGSEGYAPLAGVLAGFAVVCEYSTILLSLFCLFIVVSSKKRKPLLLFCLGFLVGVMPLLIYNVLLFGSPIKFASLYMDPALFSIDAFERSHMGFTSFHPDSSVIVRMLVYPYRGLFFYYPVLLLSFFGLDMMYKQGYKYESLGILLLFILYLLLFSTRTGTWYGGYCFGLRYILPFIPFLTLPLVFSLKRIKLLVILLAIISVSINLVGLQIMEDYVLDDTTLFMSSHYLELQKTHQVMFNPLKDHYLRLFTMYGPRSRVFESIWFKKGVIDIRDSTVQSEDYPSFLGLLPIAVLVSLIWLDAKKLKKIKFPLLLLLIILASTFLRVYMASQAKGIYRGDEHEYLGLANEMVFGNVAYKQTFRPYSFSLLIAVPFMVARLLNVENPDTIILFARLLNVCFSVLLTYVVFLTGKKLFELRVGLIAAFLVGFSWLVTSWTIRVMTEVISALLILMALYFAFDTMSRNRLIFAGIFLGLASMMHLKNAVFLIPLFVYLLIKVRKHAMYFLVAWVLMMVLQGVIDYMTFGSLFYSVFEYIKRTAVLPYLNVLLVQRGGASGIYSLHENLFSGEKVFPFSWYFTSIPLVVGMVTLFLTLISLEKNETILYLWGNALAFVAVISLMPHKEERYLFPVVVIVFILAAKGFLRIWESLKIKRTQHHVALFLLLLIFASDIRHTYSLPLETHYNENMAMNWIGKQEDVRGVYSYYHYANSGGYLYMRNNAPLYYEYLKKSGDNITDDVNYIVVPDFLLGKYEAMLQKNNFSEVKVFHAKYPGTTLSEEVEQDVYVYSKIIESDSL